MRTIEPYRQQYIYLFDKQQSLYENYARKQGVQGKCMQILMWLYYNPQGITQKKIVEATYSTKQVVHATIKRLTQEGYIQTKETDMDRRHKLLFLTENGRMYAASILSPLRAMEAEAMESLTEDEQRLYIQLTQKYTKQLASVMDGR